MGVSGLGLPRATLSAVDPHPPASAAAPARFRPAKPGVLCAPGGTRMDGFDFYPGWSPFDLHNRFYKYTTSCVAVARVWTRAPFPHFLFGILDFLCFYVTLTKSCLDLGKRKAGSAGLVDKSQVELTRLGA